MKAKKVLFIDEVHSLLAETLSAAGFECVSGTHLSREEVHRQIADYHGIVIRSKFPVDKPFLEKACRLEFIARSGSGLENIGLTTAKEQNIAVFNSPEGNANAVGEHALGMLLALLNKMHRADLEVRSSIWNRDKNEGIELAGKTVGIIGYGHTGKAFARKLTGMDCTVLAYDKYAAVVSSEHVQKSTLREIHRDADIVSFHLPETPETRYYFNQAFVDAMQKPFVVINTSRGIVVNTQVLTQALESGKALGACLDVLEYEKSSFDADFEGISDFNTLAQKENVILSPHVAGKTRESYVKLSRFLAEKILKFYGLS